MILSVKNRIMRQVLKFFQYPFVEGSAILMVLWCFSSLVDFVAYLLYGMPMFAFYYALHGLVIAYMLVLIHKVLSTGTLRRIYDWALFGFGVINVITDVICQYNFRTKFSYDFVQIIKATTFRESSEFLQVFVGIPPIVLCLCVLVFGWLIYWNRGVICLYTEKNRKIVSAVGFFLLLGILVIATIRGSSNWQSIYINKLYLFFSKTEVVDLRKYRHDIKLSYVSDSIPQKLVVIIGESHSRHHMGLYGYEKETTPRLQILYEQGDLVVFQNVKSPACHTLDAFQRILNTYEYERTSICKKLKWYESVTLFDIARALHYTSFWISNQDKKGIYDNVPTGFSQLCDSAYFAGEGYMVAGRIQQTGNFDSNVIRLYKQHHLNGYSKGLFVFHLMGSHEAFSNRYPKQFDVFSPADYMHRKRNQRELVASYDNSVLYNDYILVDIIKLFQQDDAMIIYFSDHALDIYQSDDYYCGHARQNNQSMEAGKDIPFFIYMTKECQVRHPNIYRKVFCDRNNNLNTSMFVPKLLEWCTIHTEWNRN